jgi:hypothetical protein
MHIPTPTTWLLRGASLVSAAWAASSLVRQLDEECQLHRFLRGINSISDHGELVALRRKLSSTIAYDFERIEDPRPFLRATAAETIASGSGFCGENARVAILLLKMRGLRAHRLYLQGPRWGHVAVEHRWNDRWVLFDAHADPATMPDDEQVGVLGSDDLNEFPNAHRGRNPWLRATRLKALLRGPRTAADNWRPPSLLVGLFERPHLLKALAGISGWWAISRLAGCLAAKRPAR